MKKEKNTIIIIKRQQEPNSFKANEKYERIALTNIDST